jgi:hypothetical protein
MPRDPAFAGHCYLCGAPTLGRGEFCWEHDWAEGVEEDRLGGRERWPG